MFVVSLYIILSKIFIGNSISTSSIFRNSTSETVSLNNIEYAFYDYQVTWEEAKIFCLGLESELAVLDTEEKAAFISGHIAASDFGDEEFWIGSKMNFRNNWVWTATNSTVELVNIVQERITKLNYSHFQLENDIFCLTIFRRNHYIPIFTPTRCLQTRRFICQKNKAVQEENVINAFSARIDNNHFLFFLSKRTWYEAVAQCRIRGFQIAEILSPNEARILGIKMLKLRPRSIESAWIGGHLEDRIWKWLPSGKNIVRNELWEDKNMISGSCLQLDRHGFTLPTYLSNKCDRKRDFLCQIRTKEQNTDPVLVTAESCEYWIHFQQLNWSEANETCFARNASLVSFESPVTMKHVTNILRDNRKELRHIWVDGRLTAENDDFNKTIGQLENAGDKDLQEYYVPRCNDSRFCQSTGNCLNMDLEDYYAPMIYGLDCNIKQAFICQQRSESCSFVDGPSKSSREYGFIANYTTLEDTSKEKLSDNGTPFLNENNGVSSPLNATLIVLDTTKDTNPTLIPISTEDDFMNDSTSESTLSYTEDITTLSSEPTSDFAKEISSNDPLTYSSETTKSSILFEEPVTINYKALFTAIPRQFENTPKYSTFTSTDSMEKSLVNGTEVNEPQSSELLSFNNDTSFFNDTRLYTTKSEEDFSPNTTMMHKLDTFETSTSFFSEESSTSSKLEGNDFEISVRNFNSDFSLEATTIKSVNERFQEILELFLSEESDANDKKIREGLSRIVEASFAKNMKNNNPLSDPRLKKSNVPASNLDEDEYTRIFDNRFFTDGSVQFSRERNKGPSNRRSENKPVKVMENHTKEHSLNVKSNPVQFRRNKSYSTKDSIQSIRDPEKSSSPNFGDLMHALKRNLDEKNLSHLSTATPGFSSGAGSPWNVLFTRITHHLNVTKSDKKLIGFDVKEIPFH